LEDSLTDAQLTEWQQFYSVEPWGSEMDFFRSGIVASAAINASPNRKQGSKGSSPKDFMPTFEKPVRPKTAYQEHPLRNDLMAAFGARNKKADG